MINFNKIVSNLFVGTCPRNHLDAQRLKQAGITAVLNLQTDEDFDLHKVRLEKLQSAYNQLDISLFRVPIVDFDKDDLVVHLPYAAETLKGLMQNNHSVYVHCTAGMERSPAVAVTYLAWHKQWGLEEALNLVKAARNCKPYEDALERANDLYLQSLNG